MANSYFESFKGGTELSNDIKCVCCKQKQLTHLVQLACFHLACKDCLQRKLQEPLRGNQFSCPGCEEKWMIPSNGLDSFSDEPLQHRLEQITRILSNETHNCKLCKESNAISKSSRVCIKCKMNLCEYHAKYHVMKPGHTVITRAEIGVEANLILMMNINDNMCQKHDLEKNRFCKKCHIQICPSCPTCKSYDRYSETAVEVASKYRKILERKKEEVKKVRMRAEENKIRLFEKLAGINEDYQRKGEQLQKERIGWKKLEEKRQKMNKEAQLEERKFTDRIAEEKVKAKQCDSAENYFRMFLQFASDSDVIDKFQTFLNNLEYYGIMLKEKEEKDLKLRWESEAVFVDNEETDPSNWSGVALGEENIFAVFGTTLKRFSLALDKEISYQLSDLKQAGDLEVCCDELFISDRIQRAVLLYDINKGFIKEKNKLTLPQREKSARGELGLAVNKVTKDIYVSSRETNTVYRYEKKSKEFIPWIEQGLNEPYYLSMAPDHHVVVSNSGSNQVMKFNSKGEAVCSFGFNRSKERLLSYPLGVCTDLWDHVYIADFDNDRIVVVSGSGDRTRFISFKRNVKPQAISFWRDKLVTTSLGQIHVFKIMFT